MKGLFIKLYLDEDVSSVVAELLRARGFEAVTTQEAGLLRNTDAAQLAHAVSLAAAFLTHNRSDFELLVQQYFSNQQSHYGMIIAVQRPPHEIVRRLLFILNHVTADEMKNQLRYI